MDKIVLAGIGARCGDDNHGGDNTVEPGTLMVRDGREGHTVCVHCAFGVTSTGLTGLVETLCGARDAALDANDGRYDDWSDVDDNIDWSDLPTFGGEEPPDTSGIWSWDAAHMLVGGCLDELEIVVRA